ncbi:hypothetical protein GCM10009525_22630 [Streptosporangium amethystogenes subsp. fukuiense]
MVITRMPIPANTAPNRIPTNGMVFMSTTASFSSLSRAAVAVPFGSLRRAEPLPAQEDRG